MAYFHCVVIDSHLLRTECDIDLLKRFPSQQSTSTAHIHLSSRVRHRFVSVVFISFVPWTSTSVQNASVLCVSRSNAVEWELCVRSLVNGIVAIDIVAAVKEAKKWLQRHHCERTGNSFIRHHLVGGFHWEIDKLCVLCSLIAWSNWWWRWLPHEQEKWTAGFPNLFYKMFCSHPSEGWRGCRFSSFVRSFGCPISFDLMFFISDIASVMWEGGRRSREITFRLNTQKNQHKQINAFTLWRINKWTNKWRHERANSWANTHKKWKWIDWMNKQKNQTNRQTDDNNIDQVK